MDERMVAGGLDPERFLAAQAPVLDAVGDELRRGRKRTHWMWFVFPQLAGLGSSAMSQRYAIAGGKAARAYLAHPVLGARLRECTALVLAHRERSARAILGEPDDLKLRSSMTLFDRVAPPGERFGEAIARFFDGVPDARMLALLDRAAGAG